MELDEVKRTIQDFFQENTVTIVGSGLSLLQRVFLECLRLQQNY